MTDDVCHPPIAVFRRQMMEEEKAVLLESTADAMGLNDARDSSPLSANSFLKVLSSSRSSLRVKSTFGMGHISSRPLPPSPVLSSVSSVSSTVSPSSSLELSSLFILLMGMMMVSCIVVCVCRWDSENKGFSCGFRVHLY